MGRVPGKGKGNRKGGENERGRREGGNGETR